jgi:hypothetical protein
MGGEGEVKLRQSDMKMKSEYKFSSNGAVWKFGGVKFGTHNK